MITTYQIRNVLRVYSSQLKRKTTSIRDSVETFHKSSDFVNISIKAKRQQMLNQISDHLISQIVSNEYHHAGDNKSSGNPQSIEDGDRSGHENS